MTAALPPHLRPPHRAVAARMARVRRAVALPRVPGCPPWPRALALVGLALLLLVQAQLALRTQVLGPRHWHVAVDAVADAPVAPALGTVQAAALSATLSAVQAALDGLHDAEHAWQGLWGMAADAGAAGVPPPGPLQPGHHHRNGPQPQLPQLPQLTPHHHTALARHHHAPAGRAATAAGQAAVAADAAGLITQTTCWLDGDAGEGATADAQTAAGLSALLALLGAATAGPHPQFAGGRSAWPPAAAVRWRDAGRRRRERPPQPAGLSLRC